MKEQDPGQFSGRVEISPINSWSTVARVENEGIERWVERSQKSEVRRALGVLVFGMNRGPLLSSSSLLAPHFQVSSFKP